MSDNILAHAVATPSASEVRTGLWITDEGHVIPVDHFGGHASTARALRGNGSYTATKDAGWIRKSSSYEGLEFNEGVSVPALRRAIELLRSDAWAGAHGDFVTIDGPGDVDVVKINIAINKLRRIILEKELGVAPPVAVLPQPVLEAA